MGKEKWTIETVTNEAKKYKIKNHFRTKCSGGYKYAKRHNLLDTFTWFEMVSKPMYYWTKENCENESRKYKSRTEFKAKASGAYEKAREKGWIDEYVWLENKNITKDKVDNIYGYFFKDKTVYIGRTLNIKRRDNDHRKSKKRDSVFRYAEKNGVDIPPITIIENGITIEEGAKREQFWIDFYKKNNFNVLNKQKGGGLGSITFNKYSKKQITEEASKYKTRKEFMDKSPKFYYYAWKTGLIKKLIPSKQVYKYGFWKDRKNVEKKSKEFETLKEFSKNSKGAYDAAQKGGYLNELTWLKRERNRKK